MKLSKLSKLSKLLDLDNLISDAINSSCKNLELELQKLAIESTAKLIQQEFIKSERVATRNQVIDIGLSHARTNPGAYFEFGVFKGDSLNYIASKIDENIYRFDSFDGLPEDWRPGFSAGAFKVQRFVSSSRNTIIIEGVFNESIPKFLAENRVSKAAFIHIDCDLYSSTKTVLSGLREIIGHGSILVFDEFFNYPGWESGEYKALQDFLDATNLKCEYLAFNKFGEQCVVKIIDNE